MKRKIAYGISLIAAVFLTSCLDEDPLYSQNSKTIFSSEENAELALLGCYGYMTANAAYGQMWQEVPLVGSGLAWSQRSGDDGDGLASLSVVPGNGLVSSAWKGMYKVISEVNAFLEGLDGGDLDAVTKEQMSGEARFLRGLAYYNLVALWGDVPLKLVASSSDGIAMPRTAKEEVFASIVKDMKAAMNTSETASTGRVNAWAAKAFLGKIYYKMAMLDIDREANLNNAKKMFDDVYEHAGYELQSDINSLFLPYTDSGYAANSKEAIFQLNFNASSTICYNRGSNRFAPAYSTSGVTWGTYRVAKYAYDLHYGTYPGDPRVETNFLTQWRARSANNQPNPKPQVSDELCPADSVYSYPKRAYTPEGMETKDAVVLKLPYELFADKTNPTLEELNTFNGEYPAMVKALWNNFTVAGNSEKWPYFGKLYDQGQSATRSNKHLIVYRYAEMLLLMADVYNELDQKDRAIELANEVLKRARESVFPAATQPTDWPKTLTKEQVCEKLYFERIFELMGEPSLYEMVRIRGTEYMERLLLKNNNHDLTRTGNDNYQTNANNFLDRVFDGGTTTSLSADFLRKNLLLPIPSSEIDANSAITNADNNFGY